MSDTPTAPEKTKLGWMDYVKMLFKGRAAVETALNEGKLVVSTAQTAGVKTIGFWLTVASSLGAVAAQVGGLVPPPYGSIVLAASTLLYAISRGVVKNGDELGGVKPMMATSEAWANILAAAGQVALASSGAVSPEVATLLMSVNAGAVAMAQGLAKGGAQPK